VTESVHEAGGKIYLQLWHMGRAGHSDVFMHRPLAPSAIALEGEVPAAYHQRKPYETPEAMTHRQIRQAVGEYKQAALNAIAAGFDGCQVHGANGYLIEQFLQPSSNQRRDEYGGSLTNRLRFLKEVLEAVTGAIGPDRFLPVVLCRVALGVMTWCCVWMQNVDPVQPPRHGIRDGWKLPGVRCGHPAGCKLQGCGH
jgi:N-ethylmaleimide reductase